MASEGMHPEAEARMVDVTGKDVTARVAVAGCEVVLSEETRAVVLGRRLDKGDALEVARLAGIMAAKKTSELIPLCHPIGIGGIEVRIEPSERGLSIEAEVRTNERTGVEMEAMTAVSVAALTIYDMVKGTERGVTVTDLRLLRKEGGRSGVWSA